MNRGGVRASSGAGWRASSWGSHMASSGVGSKGSAAIADAVLDCEAAEEFMARAADA